MWSAQQGKGEKKRYFLIADESSVLPLPFFPPRIFRFELTNGSSSSFSRILAVPSPAPPTKAFQVEEVGYLSELEGGETEE